MFVFPGARRSKDLAPGRDPPSRMNEGPSASVPLPDDLGGRFSSCREGPSRQRIDVVVPKERVLGSIFCLCCPRSSVDIYED